MVRSPRVQRALLAVLAASLAVSGAAFASTAGAQLAWQQRDDVSVRPVGYEVAGGDEPTVRVRLRASNPTGVAATVSAATIVVYRGEPSSGERLSVPRTARLAGGAVTVPPGGATTLTIVADVPPDGVERLRRAVGRDRAVASGTLLVEMRGRSFYADV